MLMLVNLKTLKIVKVAPTEGQLGYWADIELPGISYYIDDFSLSVLEKFSLYELEKMYIASSGNEAPSKRDFDTLAGSILKLEEALLDNTDCKSLYAILKREPSEVSINTAVYEKKGVAVTTCSPSSQVSGSKLAIFEAADLKWEALGKPSDIKEVRKMRLELMNELQEQGFNRNTVSSTLGQWQKQYPQIG